MAHKLEHTESVEKVEKPAEGTEKEGHFQKAKEFVKNLFGGGETTEKTADTKGDQNTEKMEKKPSFRDGIKVDTDLKTQAEQSKAAREKLGLDENGQKIEKKPSNPEDNTSSNDSNAEMHGEGGERTRYSDAQANKFEDIDGSDR